MQEQHLNRFLASAHFVATRHQEHRLKESMSGAFLKTGKIHFMRAYEYEDDSIYIGKAARGAALYVEAKFPEPHAVAIVDNNGLIKHFDRDYTLIAEHIDELLREASRSMTQTGQVIDFNAAS